MVDPYTIFQTAEAAISLAKFLGELISKVEHALEFREIALARLKRAEVLCQDAGELLQTYGARFSQFDAVATNLTFNINEAFGTTNTILEELSADLKPLEKSFRDRIKVVAKQRRIEHNLNMLEAHCSIISRRMAYLTLTASMNQTDGLRKELLDDVRKELLQFREDLAMQYRRRSLLEDSLCLPADADGDVAGEDGPEQDIVNDQRQTLESTLNLLDSSLIEEEKVYERLASNSGLDVQQDAIFIPYDLETTPAQFEKLRKRLIRHEEEAQICMGQERWRRAEVHLGKALSYYDKCREQEPMGFQELVALTNGLALVQQKQHKWRESIMESHRLIDMITSFNAEDFLPEPSEHTQQSSKALCLQTLADTHYEKYKLNQKDANDLEEAQRFADAATNIYDDLRESMQLQPEYEHSHKRCHELLISIYNALGETTEADLTREELNALSTTTSTPSDETVERLRSLSASSPPSTPQDISYLQNLGSDTHEKLIQAISMGHESALQAFLPFKDSVGLEKPCANGKTPLMHAIAAPNNAVSLVNQLLGSEWRADPNGRGAEGTTPLYLAADLKRLHIVDILVDQGADKELKDSDDETPLMRATRLCQDDFVQKLLEHGANIDVEWEDKSSLLHRAVKNCSTATTIALLDKDDGMLLAKKKDRYGKTALHLCASEENAKQAKAILNHPNAQGILNLPDAVGRTALYLIVAKVFSEARLDFVRLLLSFDRTGLQRCEAAASYHDYRKRIANERRGSTNAAATTGSSSSDGKQPKKRARLFGKD